jgi:NDP-4-keto-2,6-dideoxyhexose 3-C-methyltransferase
MYKQISRCRICGASRLERVLDLGEQFLTGVFPRSKDEQVTCGPLRLVKCVADEGCGLLQLEHSYDLGEMYGENYGYRSGLNPSMVAHLQRKVAKISGQVALTAGDLVIDIGSNDGTTLGAYAQPGLTRVGIDPTGTKFREFYPAGVDLIPEFFSSALFRARFGDRKARVITSFSMFYDLEAPMDFMRQVHEILADDGIWVFEQSYMPSMLRTNSFDTVCHEHLEFYGLSQIQWMADRVGFQIVDVEFNDVNGGSFSVTARRASKEEAPLASVRKILDAEISERLHTLDPYRAFEARARAARDALVGFVREARAKGKVVAALGASTKGNVLLQYCGFTSDDIVAVGEVNPDKFGHLTPGTWIPIVPESDLLSRRPDYLLVLPWHFRQFFETAIAFRRRRLVFPLPDLSVVDLQAA